MREYLETDHTRWICIQLRVLNHLCSRVYMRSCGKHFNTLGMLIIRRMKNI